MRQSLGFRHAVKLTKAQCYFNGTNKTRCRLSRDEYNLNRDLELATGLAVFCAENGPYPFEFSARIMKKYSAPFDSVDIEPLNTFPNVAL